MKNSKIAIRFCVFLLGTLWSSFAAAGMFDWINDNMIDPEDGKFDMSQYLASAYGFFPVPLVITEPAVGFGLGAAVAYFHKPKSLDAEQHPHQGPPSISAVFGAKTDNGTYLYGGAHSGVWRDDHIRYLGAVAKMNVNLTWYPNLGNLDNRLEDGIEFNIDGVFLLQEMQFRLKESNWWLGGSYLYVNADNTFKIFDDLPIDLPNPGFDFSLGAVSAFVEYDGRDSTFTPADGLNARLEYQDYGNSWGSDFDFRRLSGEFRHFRPFGDHSSLGLRLDGDSVSGDVPFFAYPFVELRGIPALRYQGKSVLTGEAEFLWGFTPRWSLVLFGGVGKTTDITEFETDGRTVAAGGVGFRYRLARLLGLQGGIDVARGPEDTSVYLTVGNAW